MIEYQVIWRPSAQDRLAEIWLKTRDRDAVARAMHQIEDTLRRAPFTAGESRSDYERILIESPLVVAFEVDRDEHVAIVLAVREIPNARTP